MVLILAIQPGDDRTGISDHLPKPSFFDADRPARTAP
jgi:hypothetical protein